jgi:hypothetical protein
MRRGSAAIDDILLRRLYLDENLTAHRIATQLGCSSATIFRRLRRFGIAPRRRGPAARRTTPPAWNVEAAYAVGLAATDGNLSSDGRHMSFISKDRDLVETFHRCLGLTTVVRTLATRTGSAVYRVQWCDRRLYDWFLSLGLMPAKSLRLGHLAVPDDRFADFFRGCIDGDGSVLVYTDRYHSRKKDRYVYERLYVSLVSASLVFIDWVRMTVLRLAHVAGALHESRRAGQRPIWTLRYAKADSIRLLRWMYYAPDVPCLDRKRVTAERFLGPLGCASVRSVGRPKTGWLYNTHAEDPNDIGGLRRGGVTAAALDSKSSARKGVRVQLPPPVPALPAFETFLPSLTTPATGR